MNILVVTGSPRKDGNTELLADVFAQAQLKDICDYFKWENKGVFTASDMVEMGSIYQSSALAQVTTSAGNL